MALAEQLPQPEPPRHRKKPPRRRSLELEVGAQIRAHRKLQELTLAQLAASVGTNPQTLCRIETAGMTISLSWIERIAAALEIEPYQLLGGESAIGRANAAAIKARAELKAFRAAGMEFYRLLEATVPEQGGTDGGIDA